MLVEAKRLHTIIDVGDVHSTQAPHPPLSRKEVRLIMLQQPTIEKVIADNRVWTVRHNTILGWVLQRLIS